MIRPRRVGPILLLITGPAWAGQPSTSGSEVTRPGAAAPPVGREAPVMRAAGRGAPWVNLADGRAVPARLPEGSRAAGARNDRSARPLSLASADFDEDGVPDLVASFATAAGGFLTLHRGNVDSIYPNAPEAKARRAAGTYVDSPFLPDARSFDTREPADFIAAGDFDADGHADVAAAAFGRGTVALYAGDGDGGFAKPEALTLPGSVTAMIAGEVNRRDGLPDLVIGVDGPNGALALVFEGPDGAFHSTPERFPLTEPPLDFAIEQLGDPGRNDLAIGASGGVVIVHGRDRRLSHPEEDRRLVPEAVVDRFTLPFTVRAMAAGDFDGDRRTDLAFLDDGGLLHIAAPGELKQIARGMERAPQRAPSDVKSVPARSPDGAREARLIRAKVSSPPGDDLLLLRRAARRLDLRMPRSAAAARGDAPESGRPAWITFDAVESPVAIVPMRLNRDSLSDLVLLSEGAPAISSIETLSAMTFTVTNTSPGGPGSLAQAIDDANSNVGADTIEFDIPGAGPHVISATSAYLQVTDPVTIDATTEPGFAGSPIVVLDGGSALSDDGLVVNAGATTIAGMVISHYRTSGVILADVAGDTVEGNFIGTDVTGTSAAGNGVWGVQIHSSPFTTIGGTTPAARNIISGNGYTGIIVWELSPGVLIEGNYIGTDRSGTTAIPNLAVGGIDLRSASSVTIGGTTVGTGNVVSGNHLSGVALEPESSGNLIQGNLIGTNATGSIAVGNGYEAAVHVSGSSNTIGGTSPGARNVISGNSGPGIQIAEALGMPATLNIVQQNLIGTDRPGTAALGNGGPGVQVGGEENLIGGTILSARNIVSGNLGIGVALVSGGDRCRVAGNYIGTTAFGSAPLGNQDFGVSISNAADNLIGGPGALANVIAANATDGVFITGPGATGNLVEVNYIGTNAAGDAGLGNRHGINLLFAGSNQIGVKLGQGNVISGNTGNGVSISDSSGIALQGNIIGLDPAGDGAMPNLRGVLILGSGNVIGGATTGEGNVISGNVEAGVIIGSSLNTVQNNIIGLRLSGDAARPNGGSGISVEGGSANIIGGAASSSGNTISGNAIHGVFLTEANGNTVAGNLIGMDRSGTVAIGNGWAGVALDGSSSNVIGGSGLEGNTIAFNAREGIVAVGTGANAFRANAIFSNGLLGVDLGEDSVTANDVGDVDAGPNDLQNFPAIATVTTTGGSLALSGTLDSTSLTSFGLDFFLSPSCDPLGHGEGRTYLGSAPVATDPSGHAGFLSSFIIAVGAGDVVTATATSGGGATSEFSACATAVGVPPAAVTGVKFDSKRPDTLLWDTTPGATQFHIYAGTRSTLPGLVTQAADSCEAGVVQTPDLPFPPAGDPPTGSMLWFLVTAEGPYGEGPVQPASNGPRQLTSVGQCGASCAHDICAPGNPLIPPCAPCASIVCDADANCCTNVWDAVCVKEVRAVCRNLQCPDSQGQCTHSVCKAGAPLSPGCDAPPLPVSCTAAICQADPSCCQQTWDAACIDKVSTVCGYNCL